MDLLINEAGSVRAASAPELNFLDGPIRHGDLTGYLVRNCGHVRLRQSDHGKPLSVSLRRGSVNLAAATSVVELVLDIDPPRIVVDFVDEGLGLLLVVDADDLASMLIEQDGPASALRRPRIFQEPLSLDRLKLDPRLSPLRATYENWRRTRGHLRRGTQNAFGHRQAMMRLWRDRVEFHALGNGYLPTDAQAGWVHGADVADQRDRNYGAWVAENALRVGHSFTPRIDVVEATLSFDGMAPVRARYDRLLLPWSTDFGIGVSTSSVTRLVFPPT